MTTPIGADGAPLGARGYAKVVRGGSRRGRVARIARIVWLGPRNVPPAWRVEFDDGTQVMSGSVIACDGPATTLEPRP